MKLFRPQPEESAVECLERRSNALIDAVNKWSTRDQVVNLEDGQRVKEDFSEFEQQELNLKCRCLHKAYDFALIHMPNYTWKECCEMASKQMKSEATSKFSYKFIANLNIEFRKQEGFDNPIRKKEYHVEFFALFPEARTKLFQWGSSTWKHSVWMEQGSLYWMS